MLAYDIRDDYEVIEGEKFMAPSADTWHNNTMGKLFLSIGMHVATNKLGLVFTDSLDVHFPDGNLFKPDFMFISAENSKIVLDNKHSTIHGVPDMVAEIFSRSTMKRDMTIKKDIYERNGVKEYWIINPWSESIEVYLLRNGKYELEGVYQNYSEEELNELTEEERAEVKFEIPVTVLDGFKIKIKNIFGWFIE
ncbi:MAG: Uma2 family endonuclease [Selenomonadaceae bacterium]|nr:Uma2 family endonuclease [Selenomonadaceae bacterium]